MFVSYRNNTRRQNALYQTISSTAQLIDKEAMLDIDTITGLIDRATIEQLSMRCAVLNPIATQKRLSIPMYVSRDGAVDVRELIVTEITFEDLQPEYTIDMDGIRRNFGYMIDDLPDSSDAPKHVMIQRFNRYIGGINEGLPKMYHVDCESLSIKTGNLTVINGIIFAESDAALVQMLSAEKLSQGEAIDLQQSVIDDSLCVSIDV